MNTREKRGQILRQLREKQNVRQKDIADYLEITQQAYQRYEAGTSEPSGDLLCKIANFYGVTTDYLLGRDVQSITPLEMLSKQENMDEIEEVFLQKYLEMPPEGRDAIIKAMRSVVDTLRKSGAPMINVRAAARASGDSIEKTPKDEPLTTQEALETVCADDADEEM